MPPAVGVQAVEGAYLDEQAFVGARERWVWRGWQGGFNAAFLPRTLQTCILMEKTGRKSSVTGRGGGTAGLLAPSAAATAEQTFWWYTNKQERC